MNLKISLTQVTHGGVLAVLSVLLWRLLSRWSPQFSWRVFPTGCSDSLPDVGTKCSDQCQGWPPSPSLFRRVTELCLATAWVCSHRFFAAPAKGGVGYLRVPCSALKCLAVAALSCERTATSLSPCWSDIRMLFTSQSETGIFYFSHFLVTNPRRVQGRSQMSLRLQHFD